MLVWWNPKKGKYQRNSKYMHEVEEKCSTRSLATLFF